MRGEFLDLSGARLYYYAAGTRGAGNPVVFLHGFPTSGHLWNDVVPLMPAGHRIVVLDLLGYGRSDRPLHRPLSPQAHADRVIELFDELRIGRACVVGHGLGGGIAQVLALRHGDRVSHLCLADSIALGAWPTMPARLARATLPLTRFLPPTFFQLVLRRALLRGYRDPERAARSVELYLRPFAMKEGRDALAAHLRALHGGETAELGAQLASLRVPTAIVWGRHDHIVPLSVGQRLHQSISNSTFDIVDDARHFTPEEAPRRLADAVAALLARA